MTDPANNRRRKACLQITLEVKVAVSRAEFISYVLNALVSADGSREVRSDDADWICCGEVKKVTCEGVVELS